MSKPLRLSVSQIEAYRACPRQWYMKSRMYIDTPQTAATEYGQIDRPENDES